MSQYVSWSELAARYAKIASEYDTQEVQDGFLNGAEAELDSRLSARYTVPFTPVPAMVKDLVIDMAYYRMTFGAKHEEALRNFIERRIGALVTGSASLVVSGSLVPTTDVSAWSERGGIRSVFGPDSPENYSVSTDWQNTAQNERNND